LISDAKWKRFQDVSQNSKIEISSATGRDYHETSRIRSTARSMGAALMTETISRGAANQSGAHLNKNAYAEAGEFLPLNGLDHVEFWVGNSKQAAHYFRALWGFTPIAYSGLETGIRDRSSYVLRREGITLVVTGALGPDSEIAEHVHRHGDGVKDIAFAVDDATSSWRETTMRGARSVLEPVELDGGEDGILRRSAVATYGDVQHSFIDRREYHGVFAPGYRRIKKPARAASGLSLLEIDHCVGNVELGDMNRFVDYYRDVFGFAQLIHYDDKVIHTEYSALMSKVMTNGNGRIKFPINEPASGKKKSQIQEFLDYYLDNGTQHIALRTEDIVGTVRQLRENGVEFLGMPHAYYETLAERVGDVGVPIETLEELGIEADRDEEGYLLQIFTRPIQDRPTFFFEVIERHGSRGFGVGNFKALFEAIEIEQARRGNL
jgi:4-hydroxyphenylpyruvate dioxygenase